MNLPGVPTKKFRVAAFDYGAKYTIYRKLVNHGFEVQIFPRHGGHAPNRCANTDPTRSFSPTAPATRPPGPYIHQTVTALLPEYPTFGICLGHQMITHALGGSTFQLEFGHRGGNQPG